MLETLLFLLYCIWVGFWGIINIALDILKDIIGALWCMHARMTKNKGVIMFVEKDKGISEKASNKNHVSMCLRRVLNKLFYLVSNPIRNNAMMQAGLMFTLKCAAIAAVMILGSWGFLCFALVLPNPIRTLIIWAYLFAVCIAAQAYNPQRRC